MRDAVVLWSTSGAGRFMLGEFIVWSEDTCTLPWKRLLSTKCIHKQAIHIAIFYLADVFSKFDYPSPSICCLVDLMIDEQVVECY